jgi:hypothetical protein
MRGGEDLKNCLSSKFTMFFISLALVLSIVGMLLLNGSAAWFATNDNISANGFSVKTKTSPNLIIGKTPEELLGEDLLFEVDFKDVQRTNMIAVTHDGGVPVTYLKYLESSYAVDNATGLAKPGEELKLKPVPEEDNESYFIDYTVYIASAFAALDVESLNATITVPDGTDLSLDYIKAVSVDFYVGEVSSLGYRGTTSIAEAVGDSSYDGVALLGADGGTIPLNTTGNYIKVIVRCYFDGALVDEDSGKAYVNSYTVKTDKVAFGVSITAADND